LQQAHHILCFFHRLQEFSGFSRDDKAGCRIHSFRKIRIGKPDLILGEVPKTKATSLGGIFEILV
jgi:hypothetical protein